jgi:hypothetical protein
MKRENSANALFSRFLFAVIEILLFNCGDFCADLFFKHYGIRFIVLTLRLCNLDSILDEFDAMRDT